MRGETEALRAIWHQHRRWVAAILLAHKPHWCELDDLLQDVAATFVRKVGELRDAGAIKPWLRTVAINAARAAARDRKAKEPVSTLRFAADGEPPTSGAAGTESSAAARDEAARLLELAMQLPEGYREPLLLRCLRDMSYRQIGEITGLPETTIETRIARGRRMLRELASGQQPREVGAEGGKRVGSSAV